MATLHIHLLHGTQFYFTHLRFWRKPRIQWVEDDPQSPDQFCAGVRTRLEAKGYEVRFHAIGWSGHNLHGSRRKAADKLLSEITPEDGEPHFIVAHSHGGNACMLALRKDERENGGNWGSQLRGIVCLATPFLVVQPARWALLAATTWLALVLLGVTILINRIVESGWFAFLLSIVAMLPIALSFLYSLRRYRDVDEWKQAPLENRVPTLIVRCAGDEASSGLGFVMTLARIVYYLGQLATWPIRTLRRHPIGLWLGGSVLIVAAAVLAALYSPFLDLLSQVWASLSRQWTWALLLLFGAVPLRLIVYGLAYGMDLFGLPLKFSISAEATPIGRWTSWLVGSRSSEKLPFAHSEVYALPVVHDLVAEWCDKQAAAVPTGRSGLAESASAGIA
jgi:hypothetical protein